MAICNKKHLLFLFYLLIAGSIAFRFYFSDYANLYLNTLSRADVMVIGAIGAYYYSEKPFVFQLNKIVRLLLYGLLFASLTTEQFSSWETPFMAGFKKYFYMLFIGVLLLDYNFNPLLKLRLSGYKFINYLDRVSYGIYMYHNFLSVIIIKKIMYNIGSSSLPLFFTLMISFSIVIPILSYELFEKHFLKMGSKFRADPIQKQ
jgi:peptidoglycan/LPS O-acetylase OafA/YrhL